MPIHQGLNTDCHWVSLGQPFPVMQCLKLSHAVGGNGVEGEGQLTKDEHFSQFGLSGDDDEVEEFNSEGRLITAEFEKFFVVTTYVPNAGAKLVTLPKRMKWDPLFRWETSPSMEN